MSSSRGTQSSGNDMMINMDQILQEWDRARGLPIRRAFSTKNLGRGMMNLVPRPARSFTRMSSPFYSPIYTLLEPQELPSSYNHGCEMDAQVQCTFTLSPQQLSRLSTDEKEFPRREVQLRFFDITGDNAMPPDGLPLNCVVRINDVDLPNLDQPSRPINITSYVMSRTNGRSRMRVNWTADIGKWAVAVYLVTRVSSKIVCNRMLNSPSLELPYATTEAAIKKRLRGGQDDDVSIDSLKISLLCPLGKTRMKIAARSRDCTHIQCFDLDSFLQMNENRPTWKCCVCNKNAPFNNLVIDKYFTNVLMVLGNSVTEVELLKDGSYREVEDTVSGKNNVGAAVNKENDLFAFSDDDEVGCEVIIRSNRKRRTIPPSAPVNKRIDTITIDDDEEAESEVIAPSGSKRIRYVPPLLCSFSLS